MLVLVVMATVMMIVTRTMMTSERRNASIQATVMRLVMLPRVMSHPKNLAAARKMTQMMKPTMTMMMMILNSSKIQMKKRLAMISR